MLNISYIIPCFNCSSTILETLESIIKTNYIDGDEIIIIDDKSTDITLNLLNKYINDLKNKNIYIIKNKENQGCATAGRNIGSKYAKNSYLFFIDSDNILEENSIKKMRYVMNFYKPNLVSFGGIKFFIGDKKNITHKRIFPDIITIETELYGNVSICGSGNYAIKKTFYKEKGGSITDVGGAYDSFISGLNFLMNGEYILTIPDTYYLHRYGYNSTFIKECKKKNPSNLLRKYIIKYITIFENSNKNIDLLNNGNWFQNRNKLKLECMIFPKNIGSIKYIYNFSNIKNKLNLIYKKIKGLFKK